ncbi:MAG TPA: cytochrome c oxidase subunit II [Alphaproteobacteria bacterium]|nr:cytochrome c oxidase subunit II [Alphaproteobacteria bacterium]
MKQLLTFLSVLISPFFAFSEEYKGMAYPMQLGFQDAASPVMERLDQLHDWLLIMCFGISLFVLALLVYVCIRFRASKNPVPSKTTHNTLIEVIWTVVPIMILVAIIIPSWRLINYMHKHPDPEITIKAIGYQWYWGYEYVDGLGKGINFESYMKLEKAPEGQEALQLQEGEPRLLATDNKVVVPVNTPIRVLTTAADVIHAWAVPAFGVKKDAMPGRINETWFKATKQGTFYGQCSELCGSKHAFMPIEVKVVSKKEYKKWVKEKSKELGLIKEEPKAEEGKK